MTLSESLRRWMHTLLALLVLTSGVLAALQSTHHGGELHHDVHSVVHEDHQIGAKQVDDLHHLNAIDSGVDEHGHHFHVHLSAPAVASLASSLTFAAMPALVPAVNPLLPDSLSYAPPVPPPNV